MCSRIFSCQAYEKDCSTHRSRRTRVSDPFSRGEWLSPKRRVPTSRASAALSLRGVWEQEELSSASSMPLTGEEKECEAHFASTHARTSDGRYVVRLPVKGSPSTFGDSRSAALRVLNRMEQRFARDDGFAKAYADFLTEYEALGHLELATSKGRESPLVYYLPHHGVIQESSETTKLRVVFNGSLKTSLGISLNNHLFVGPSLLPDLFVIMLWWWMHAVVLSADMEKTFRQILVHPDDRDLQRVLWCKSFGVQPDAYRLCTVTYGLACAPYLVLRVVRQPAIDEQEYFPRGCQILLNDAYVDDVLSGADDVAAALVKQSELVGLLKAGVLSHLSLSLRASGTSCTIPLEASFHMLGLSWHAESDCFALPLKNSKPETPLTKRRILFTTAGLFDPLGWLAPVHVSAKIFLQTLWLRKLGWDEPLSDAEAREWFEIYSHRPRITDVQVPRWLKTRSTPHNVELHGFADAS